MCRRNDEPIFGLILALFKAEIVCRSILLLCYASSWFTMASKGSQTQYLYLMVNINSFILIILFVHGECCISTNNSNGKYNNNNNNSNKNIRNDQIHNSDNNFLFLLFFMLFLFCFVFFSFVMISILLCKDEIMLHLTIVLVTVIMYTQSAFKRNNAATNAFNTIKMEREYNVSDFIIHGQQDAIIEITLHDGIKDQIHKGVTTWRLKKGDVGDIGDIVVELNIKVNSLCLWLAQERLSDFARSTNVKLSFETDDTLFRQNKDLIRLNINNIDALRTTNQSYKNGKREWKKHAQSFNDGKLLRYGGSAIDNGETAAILKIKLMSRSNKPQGIDNYVA